MDGVKEFKREARYAVFKFSKLDSSQSKILQDAMCRLPRVAECVVIESDWPEYNFVWLMLEHRMGGYPVPDFNAVKCAADVQVALAREAALKYKAELYEEVWQKATDMGFMNVTMALEQVAALREELAISKRVGPPHFCGLAMSLNPHPEAGVPGRFLEVGTVSECIPCLVASRHGWAKTASDLRAQLTAAEQRNADAVRMLSALYNATPIVWPDVADFLTKNKPTESGASE